MLDETLWSGLVNIGAAALASIAIAFFEPSKNVRAALFSLVCASALTNFYFQRQSAGALNKQIDTFHANRWEPLSDPEGARFATMLSKLAKPTKVLQVVCAFAGCNDLAQSIRQSASKGGWTVAVVAPVFGPPEVPLEFWYYDVNDLSFLEAFETATTPRFKAVRRRFDDTKTDQINLFIDYKP